MSMWLKIFAQNEGLVGPQGGPYFDFITPKKANDNPRWFSGHPIDWVKNCSPSQATRVYYIYIYTLPLGFSSSKEGGDMYSPHTIPKKNWFSTTKTQSPSPINNHPRLPPNPWATIVSHWGSWICVVKVSIWRAMVLPRNAWLNGCLAWTFSRFEWKLVGW